MQKHFIPEEFHHSHDYFIDLLDSIRNILVEADSLDLRKFSLTINLAKEEYEKISHGEISLYECLMSNGHGNLVNQITKREVFFALVADFCNFIYEALECSEKRKLTVTFSLLRKPFKDNLLLLEWLLADENDFIENFNSSDSENIAPDKISKERKIEIIKKAEILANTNLNSYEEIYNLRYTKSITYGLERIWNQANHIVTTVKHYKTSSSNLNFVFTDENALLEQWKALYKLLHILMYHSTEVIISLFEKLFAENSNIVGQTKLIRDIKFIQYSALMFPET
ncbi:hypothetical protein NSQ20_25530 [Paenibacillus sp. FSL K6-1122]|uniref:hypothetical protein n=1 Tax=Paenibacillus sp. FSL K6-1122 TaxID=2954512 RepID=UPI0030EF9D49